MFKMDKYKHGKGIYYDIAIEFYWIKMPNGEYYASISGLTMKAHPAIHRVRREVMKIYRKTGRRAREVKATISLTSRPQYKLLNFEVLSWY